MTFSPIAIIGQGCVLPGALSPEALWQLVLGGQDLLSAPPEDYWRVPRRDVWADDPEHADDRTWSDQGGYVRGFGDVFDPSGFHLAPEALAGLDPLVLWTLHAAREALRSAGRDVLPGDDRAGFVLGNLSYPTPSMARYAETVWWQQAGRDVEAPDPRNRFMSGLPAHQVARALGIGGGAFALDAACASSLYAIKLACDRLHDGTADLMLAGGVNHADDLFLHVGFCALQAMSRTGQSRPFHQDADGLVPAEGAGVVVLKRLDDAVRDGDPIFGVIRGVGLANDGRSRGLLTPDQNGQVRAMRAAYDAAGLTPADVSLVECHATGTPLGDSVELRSMATLFAGQGDVPIGSLKSNLGHLITASGVAGLMKVLAAMRTGTRPPTLHVDAPTETLGETPFRVLHEAEPWTPDGLRRAAVNNFGFGGNNAHLLVEEWTDETEAVPTGWDPPAAPEGEVAVVGVTALLGDHDAPETLARVLFGDAAPGRRAEEIDFDVAALRFPPVDLKHTLPQQLLMLKAAFQLREQIDTLPPDTTGVLLGMGCDPEIARYGLRWRLGDQLPAPTGDGAAADPRDGVIHALAAAGVVGTMPNVVANRLNSQFDLRGASWTVSSEEASGPRALELAARALRRGELDAAVVGAVDLSDEVVHRAAAEALLDESRQEAADAAVLLVLKRAEDARRDGDTIYALLPSEAPEPVSLHLGDGDEALDLTPFTGHAHAASGLLHTAAAALCCYHRLRPRTAAHAARPWLPDHGTYAAHVRVDTLGGERTDLWLTADPVTRPALPPETPTPTFETFAAGDLAGLRAALAAGTPADEAARRDAAVRLTLVHRSAEEQAARRTQALDLLPDALPEAPLTELADGVYLGRGTPEGETAFVFTGPAGSYPGMGADLLRALPELSARVAHGFARMPEVVGWLYDPEADADRAPVDKLWGSSFLCQTHAVLTREVLGLEPEAAIGFCSGETNALFALGAWSDLDAMHRDVEENGVFSRALGGDFTAVKEAWGLDPEAEIDWATWRLRAEADEVRALLADIPRAYLTIINAPGDVVIAGDAAACEQVVEQLGSHRAKPLGYNLAMHCPEARAFAGPYRDLHHRPTEPVPGIRFYTHSTLSCYHPDADKAADAVAEQAMDTVDFPALIEQAYADGVRVFVEHGPQAGCTSWIGRILGDRPHVAVALDRFDTSSLRQVIDAVARLAAAGVPVDADALRRRLVPAVYVATPEDAADRPTLSFPAHWPPVQLPAPAPTPTSMLDDAEPMPPAPALPPSGDTGCHTTAAPVPAEGEWMMPPPSMRPPQPASQPAPQATPPPPATPQPLMRPAAPVPTGPAAFHAHLAQMHAAFMQHQAAAHTAFLGARTAAFEALAAAYRAWGYQLPPTGAQPPAPQPLPPAAATPPPVSAPSVGDAAAGAPPAPPTPPEATVPPAPAAPKPPVTPVTPEVSGTPVHTPRPPVGPTLSREELEVHASGRISEIFGPLFEQQDAYERQVRMPEPPLLLADRVTGIDAEPGVLGKGTLWTETDVSEDAWYLHDGRMPGGIMIESGQADLLLISWMGIDFLNQSERVYRLLGCELTYHGELPEVGDTLVYDIHIDGHARQGDVRLFFFHYDCHVGGERRLSVREGQAGFFTDEELDDSKGILWKPEDETPEPARVDPPAVRCTYDAFTDAQLAAFAEGRVAEAFGPGFERAYTHTHTPRIAGGNLRFLDEVTHFDPEGGPWGRGYLRGVQHITPDLWFFEGHFKNDPCMPGTLMFEGTLQAMALYLTALGYTLPRDGWRFEPVPEEPYPMRCRGQVKPSSKLLEYEVFVREVHDGPMPTLYADLLCTVDGLGAFHCRRMGVRLVPAYPMDRPGFTEALLPEGRMEPEPVAEVDGFPFDYRSLLACAWGRPSEAFGPFYAPFDGPRRAPRLPGPPYHFMSRITHVDGPIGAMKAGIAAEVAYDVPADAWYFAENGAPVMPHAVLLEAALQPCGWLASYTGAALSKDEDVFFRNLDGTATQHREVGPDEGTLRTRTKLTSLSSAMGSILVAFEVEVTGDAGPVYTMDTVFGFFPPGALADQAGLEVSDEHRAWVTAESDVQIDLTERPARYCGGSARLPEPMLLLPERVTGYWPGAGEAGLGRYRAEQDVDPDAWYFKAHFFEDPVQPGSLGVEALLQLLQFAMLHEGLDADLAHPRFEAIATERPLTWKYRGQVLPTADRVVFDLELTETGRDERGVYAVAEGSLWVDGLRIYHCSNLAMRLVDDAPGEAEAPAPDGAEADMDDAEPVQEVVLDPEADAWLRDHCPTYTRPALPMTAIADRLAEAARAHAPGRTVVAVEDVLVQRWVIVDAPVRLQTEVAPSENDADVLHVTLRQWWDAPNPKLSRFREVATGRVRLADAYPAAPAPFAPLDDADLLPDPYADGTLFHGPAFQVLSSVARGARGATGVLDVSESAVPVGVVHPVLLDGALQVIPHDDLSVWWPDHDGTTVAYPQAIPHLRLYGPAPTGGDLHTEVRFAGEDEHGRPVFDIQVIHDGQVWAALRLVEALFPKGPLGSAPAPQRRAFLRDRATGTGVRLSTTTENGATRLAEEAVRASDWFDGTLAAVYDIDEADAATLTRQIAVKEHVAPRAGVHPSRVDVPEALLADDGRGVATVPSLPLSRFPVTLATDDEGATVTDAGPERMDLQPMVDYWRAQLGTPAGWLGEDLFSALVHRYVRRVVEAEPGVLDRIHGRSVLYLANHEVQIESLLFAMLTGALTEVYPVTMAKTELQNEWVGRFVKHLFSYPGCTDPEVITYFDRSDHASMLNLIERFKTDVQERGISIMVHAPGTRAHGAREPVERLSSVLLDMALALELPIVPVRFAGGLPVEPADDKLVFPEGHGTQDYHFGTPIEPETLAALPYAERRSFILEALNTLGPAYETATPNPPDPAFAQRVETWRRTRGATLVGAAMRTALADLPEPGPEARRLLSAMAAGRLDAADTPEDRWLRPLFTLLAGDVDG